MLTGDRPVKIRRRMPGLEEAVRSDSGGEVVPASRRAARDLAGRAVAWAAIAFGLYLYLGRLALAPLQVGNEAMYTAPPILMLESGDYLIPRYQGVYFLDKPPLTFWLIAASYRLLGVSVQAARLPAALISLGSMLAIALWVRRRRGNRAALLAALVLMFTYGFWTFTLYFAADALFALTVTLAVIALDAAARRDSGSDLRRGALAGGSLALAFLSKGLAGLVLPVGAVAAGLALDRVWPIRALRRGLLAAAVLLALVAPWHWAMTERLGVVFWKNFYWENQFLRGTTSHFMRMARNPLFYLPVIAWAAFPWSFLLPGSLRRQKASSAPLGWFLFGLVFWSVLVMKREVYLMPIFPAIAILVAEGLDREDSSARRRRPVAWGLAAAVVALVLALLASFSGILAGLVGRDEVGFLFAAGFLELIALLSAARSPLRFRAAASAALACGLCFLSLDRIDQSLKRYDPIPQWGERVLRECPQEGCGRFLMNVNATGIEFYSRSGWVAVARPSGILLRTTNRQGFLVMETSDERLLASLPIRVEVLERRPWLPGAWFAWIIRNRRSPLQSLSLVHYEIPPATGNPAE